MRYFPFELHSHTVHSDGRMTPSELIRQAGEQMLSGIAITDHNTTAAHYGDETVQTAETQTAVIRGMEWTTFYGHFLVIGSEHEGRWRKASPETMGGHIAEFNSQGMALGIAHPFSVGGVLRTGAHWDYPMDAEAWKNIHYIEAYSGVSPHLNSINISAINKWTELLNDGFRIAVTSGRDWHVPHVPGQHAAVTYLGIEGDISTASVAAALRGGRSYVTLGPCVNFRAEKSGEACSNDAAAVRKGETCSNSDASAAGNSGVNSIGDTLAEGEYKLTLETFRDERYALWKEHCVEVTGYQITHNGEAVARGGSEIRGALCKLSRGWLRGEIYGGCSGAADESLLAFTSPVYICD